MKKPSPQIGFHDAQPDVLLSLLTALPELPDVVRYYDDFDDKVRSIPNFGSLDACSVFINGTKVSVNFHRFGNFYDQLAKHLFLHFLTEDLRISTVYNYIASLVHVSIDMLVEVLSVGPLGIKPVWGKLFASQRLTPMSFMALKGLLGFLAQRYFCGWSPVYLDFIATNLPLPGKDKYAGVRTGEVFLSAQEAASLVSYLDDLVEASVREPLSLGDEALREGCMLMCSYLFGMRPVQIASLAMRDVRIWAEDGDEIPAVHLTFRMVKQRTQSKAFPLPRRVKYEWAPLFLLQHKRTSGKGRSGQDRFFEVASAQEAGRAIRNLASEIVGAEVCANDLRHTAAQRLVDAGMSREEVAAFLGHSDVTTCLHYYQTSPSQAERVNKALGISEIFQEVLKIDRDRFISPEKLAELKGEQQIAGVPHGIPIAGIGGCSTSQPSCPYNPITSCYGCRKFMPVTDINLHKRVLADMRGVVTLFAEASRGESRSSPFMQLRLTIASIQKVIAALEGTADA